VNKTTQQYETLQKQPTTIKFITRGRSTGLPHIVDLRYAKIESSFFVLASDPKSDWVLNALAAKSVKIRRDHCVFESARYVNLQNMCRQFAATNLNHQLGAVGKEAEHH